MHIKHFIWTAVLMLAGIQNVYAACSNNEDGNPGQNGEIEYFTTDNVLRYCDDTDWVDMIFNLNSGLAGYWKLDETSGTTAFDSSGNGNDGTMQGGLNAASDSVTGIVSNAINFTGSSGFDRIDLSGFSLGSTNTVTITAWINADAPAAVQGIVFQRGSSVTGLNLRGTGLLGYHWNSGFFLFDSGLTVPTDKWVFTAVTIAPGAATLYMGEDGTLSSATNTATHTAHTLNDFQIGEDQFDSRHFDGDIDDVRIYNRTLSSAEITAIYNGTELGSACSTAGQYEYNATDDVMQWCNGSNIRRMGDAGAGSGGCSPEGALRYETDRYEFCDGNGWLDIGK